MIAGATRQRIVSVQTTMAKEDEFEKATARLSEAVADQSAAEDDVGRLQARGEFKFIRAPFDGIVTERNVDIGTFVNAGDETNGKSTPPLFRVADENKIRVFVQIPEDLAAEIHGGMKARLRVPQFPGKIFDAVVDTTSRAIDLHSRTLLVELVTGNPDPDQAAPVGFVTKRCVGPDRLPRSPRGRPNSRQLATELPPAGAIVPRKRWCGTISGANRVLSAVQTPIAPRFPMPIGF